MNQYTSLNKCILGISCKLSPDLTCLTSPHSSNTEMLVCTAVLFILKMWIHRTGFIVNIWETINTFSGFVEMKPSYFGEKSLDCPKPISFILDFRKARKIQDIICTFSLFMM